MQPKLFFSSGYKSPSVKVDIFRRDLEGLCSHDSYENYMIDINY